MTSKIVRSCDTVRAGAFFPQVQLQVPQKEMGEHRRQHMVMPAGIFAHFIVIHPEFRFPFFEALLNRPPHSTEPDKGTPGRARWRITDIVGVHGLGSPRALDHQPDGPIWQALLTQRHTLASKRIGNGPLGAFRNGALIPARRRQACRQRCHGAWGVGGGSHHALGAHVSFLGIELVLRLGALQPAARFRRNRDKHCNADTRVHRVQKIGAIACHRGNPPPHT